MKDIVIISGMEAVLSKATMIQAGMTNVILAGVWNICQEYHIRCPKQGGGAAF